MKKNTLPLVQFICEILVAVGYGIGLFPFGYIFVVSWVLPLTIVNLVLSVIDDNNTKAFTITNVIMALLSIIPILGYVFRVVGIIMSVLAAQRIYPRVKA